MQGDAPQIFSPRWAMGNDMNGKTDRHADNKKRWRHAHTYELYWLCPKEMHIKPDMRTSQHTCINKNRFLCTGTDKCKSYLHAYLETVKELFSNATYFLNEYSATFINTNGEEDGERTKHRTVTPHPCVRV